jgi:hypothetical protein
MKPTNSWARNGARIFQEPFAKVGRDALDAVLGVERIVVADEVGFRLVLAGFWRRALRVLIEVIAPRTIRQMRAGRTRWTPRTKLRMNRMTKIEIIARYYSLTGHGLFIRTYQFGHRLSSALGRIVLWELRL